MTTAIWLVLSLGLIITGINFLPNATGADLPQGMTVAISYFIKILKGWNWLFAIDTLLLAVGIVLAYEIIIWTWFHILVPLIKLLRGTTH